MKKLILLAVLTFTAGCGYIKSEIRDIARTEDGTDGSSCSVEATSSGSIITCEDGTSAVVSNGATGPVGPQGVPGVSPSPGVYNITEVVVLCPSIGGTFKESLLRLGDGSLLAHYASGANQFLSIIGQGSYVSTDGRNCHFTVGPAPTFTVSF